MFAEGDDVFDNLDPDSVIDTRYETDSIPREIDTKL